MSEPPLPSKRPFGLPLPGAAAEWLCHPDERHTYHRPAMVGETLCIGNGWLVIEAERFLLPAPEDASPAFQQRWQAIRWPSRGALFQPDLRTLDDVAGTLWRFGPKPPWERGSMNWHPRVQPAVQIGKAAIVPLAMLQLIARLPRAQVEAQTILGQPVEFAFNGGRGLLHNFLTSDTVPKTSFRLFAPKANPLKY